MALLTAAGFAAVLIRKAPFEAWILWNYIGGFFSLLLYLWVASQACRFLAEARRSGLMELLLVAPVNERQIVSGQWRGLLRMFGLPVLLLLSANVTGAALSQLSFQRIASQVSSVTTSTVTNANGTVTHGAVVVSTSVGFSSTSGANAAPTQPGFQIRSQQKAAMTVVAAAAAVLGSRKQLYFSLRAQAARA